ncbi:MAG: O-antigen ligase family protein, partial [Pirellulales bacterium]|nr:O-antigen ligase family protein [Pirellulales bacterium]
MGGGTDIRPQRSPADPVRPWLLAAVSCLLVARPFTPGVAQALYGQGGLFVLLWLLLLLVRQLTDLRRGPAPIHISFLDVILGLFFAWLIISGIAAWIQSSPRPAINSMWQWLSMGVSYLLVRQLFTSWHAIRAIVAVLIGLAAGMAAIGLEQQYRSAPEAQRVFLEAKDDPEALWDLTGEWLPPGSAQRQRYENRLFSPEPTATFALANSLAGFLAPWFVILIGLGIRAIRSSNHVGDNWNPLPQFPAQEKKSPSSPSPLAVRHRQSRPQSSLKTAWMRQKQRFRFFQGAMVFVLLVASLLLTKSRSGYLAAVLGIGLLWPLCFSGMRLRQVFSFAVLATALLGILLGLGIAAGWLDRAILTEAEKSLGYRLQYWQSTSSIIGAYPRLGCGLGQFQDTYTAYKLPDASEEIADPHNFLLEVAATAGIPAALLLITALGLLILQAFRKGDAMEETRVGTDIDGIGSGLSNVHGQATGTGNREGRTELFATEIKPVYCGGI